MRLRCGPAVVWLLVLLTGGIAVAVAAAVLTNDSSSEAKSMGARTSKTRVLILCTGNSCRSQLAEALWRHEAGDRYEVASAGVAPKAVNPLTLKVLEEIGVSTAGLRSKHVDAFAGQHFDLVITVCDPARESCPVFPAPVRYEHWPFDDPPATKGAEAEVLPVFRRVRDEIRGRIRAYVAEPR